MTIPDNIIDKAVDIWCVALLAPKFDNGDKSWQGHMGMALSSKLADTKISQTDYPEAVERFRKILSDRLKFLRDHAGEKVSDEERQELEDMGCNYIPDAYYPEHCLGSDYGPGWALSMAADKAGVPREAFSYKSDVFLHEDCVEASFGYAAPRVSYYPLPDGRWLKTSLRGKDMGKIIEAFLDGRLPELVAE